MWVQYHINYIEGMGLEDLETMERIFSHSNQLAPVIRYATAYRRRVLIDLLFQQWDTDKYLNLGKMLYDNYRQALAFIREQTPIIAGAKASLEITDDDLKRFAQEERAYLGSLGRETAEDLHQIAYVEKLQELRAVNAQLARTNRQFLAVSAPAISFMPPHSGPTDYDAETSKTRKIETDRRYLDERRKALSLEVADLEVHLGIASQWQPSDAQYMRVSKYIATRTYQRALAHLQRLVVHRLFELHKMNLAQTGYRMRRHIAKNMQTRSRAIRNAINTYNNAAAALDPPRPKLEWETISHYNFLEEFSLLNETRADIREKPWAQPAVRETLRLSRRLARAHEEIEQVHIEARRVLTHIRDEHKLFDAVLASLARTQDPIHGVVFEYATRRRSANAHILKSLKKLHQVPGFSGDPTPGTRVGLAPVADDELMEVENATELEAFAEVDGEDIEHINDEEDDDVQEEISLLAEFVGNLSI
ncbi:hypothetical protein ONZ51_g12120 [Trametes cubensis]|uniref:Uncharacterized protein n=1 Tax=Trametes cubensis TaxID=1111947 RepID=A0AAD7X773_9APHY|nr:hypothetical protein ONZ51_g12120 [Trametes cubensis]